ncbi:MAG: ATP-binding cassette domain-containing protein, partial [Chloroflexi bacterium]|nr:ATP-binding cassette domain-containing protein [Chloroflexota bacterium]
TFIKAMVGEEMNIGRSLLFAKSSYETEIAQVGSKELLKVDGLSVEAASQENQVISDWSFTLREGEILGVAGVAGNGQHELAESLMGIRPCKGKVVFDGAEMTTLVTRDLLARGIAYVPENRWDDGLLPKATVAQNLILGSHRRPPYSNGLMLNLGAILKRSQELIDEFKIKTESPQSLAANLSGGNVQRMMLARAFSQNPKLMIVHNPTQGLDIPSTEFVYNKLLERKRAGMGTLLISENLDELFLMCNRVAAIYRGRIVGVLERGQFDAYRVGRMMSGLE